LCIEVDIKTFVVTRHVGALEWIESQGIQIDEYLTHVSNTQTFTHGDVVIGALPLHLIAELNQMGVTYLNFSINVDAAHRGMELSAVELLKFNPRLEYFEVTKSVLRPEILSQRSLNIRFEAIKPKLTEKSLSLCG
jgi:CRISPR-associated protein Csx16